MASPTVCLTFDFDAISVWLGSFGLSTPTYVSRGEFAANVAAPRILDLLDRERVQTTWYISGLDVDTYPDICRRISDAGHEIGHHGYAHESPTSLDEAAERSVLDKGLDALDRVLDVRPSGYRSPAWDLSPNSTWLLVEYGFRYDSSMMGSDFEPYWCRTGDVIHTDKAMEFGPTIDLVEIPVSWTLDDFPFMEFALVPPIVLSAQTDVEAMATRWLCDLDFMATEVPDGVFAQTFHPATIGRAGRIRILERIIAHAKELGATFSTVHDAAESWRHRQTPG